MTVEQVKAEIQELLDRGANWDEILLALHELLNEDGFVAEADLVLRAAQI